MTVVAAVLPDDASYSAVVRAAADLAGDQPFVALCVFPLPAVEFEEVGLSSPAAKTAEARDTLARRIELDLRERGLNAQVEVPVATTYNPGDGVVAFADKAGAHTIVIGTHGRTGLGRLFFGSVAERVVRHAHCNVYVVRP
jgi:nucleotide-binding universal stress UspA family protein